MKINKEKIGIYLFWIFLVMKIILLIVIEPRAEFKNLFIPFLESSQLIGLNEAYSKFYQNGNLNIFPYSKIMYLGINFYSFFIGKLINRDYTYILYRLVLLTFDFILFKVLIEIIKNKRKVIFYYWCSPILFYINYIHTQLDLIPVFFLVVSIFFLMKNNIYFSFIMLGVSISAKVTAIVVIPFYMFYLYRKHIKTYKMIIAILLPIIVYIFLNIDLIQNEEFVKMVLLNGQQSSLLNIKLEFNNNSFYIVPMIYMVLIMVALKFKYYSQDLFLIFLTFSFIILTVFGLNSVGWYYWVVPFLAYFYSKSDSYSKETYFFFNIFYFLFFLSNNFNLTIRNGLFTLLQIFLFLNAYMIYKYGVMNIIKCKLKYIPFIIGVGGDSGVGKTTFTSLLETLFPKEEILVIKGDDMHKWERGDENWDQLTHLSPKANMLYQNYKHIEELKMQKNIRRQHYDHDTGKFTDKILLKSKRIVIFEGLHPFYLKKNRTLYDFKIYIKPQEELRLHWKISRDMTKRGYTKEKILEQLKKREEDSKKYIDVQEKYSDLTIQYYNIKSFKDIGNVNEKIELGLSVKLDNTLSLDFLIEKLIEKTFMKIEHYYDEDYQILKFEGEVSSEILRSILTEHYTEIDELFDGHIIMKEDFDGILQILIIAFIFEFNLKVRT